MRRFAACLLKIIFIAVFISPASAEEGLEWRETRTEHCVFIYRRRDEAAARELAGFAEEVYADVTGYLDSRPREVRAVVLGDVDEANGSYSAPPHHLELYVRAPIAPWHGARGEGWLRLLFIHELCHFCDMDSDYGFFFVLSLILGEGVKSGDVAFEPPWTYEGLAVLLETDISRGGRGRNPYFLMRAKAVLADNVPFTLGHLEYGTAYPPADRYYLFGYLFMDFLKREYGQEVYRKIRRRYLDFPFFGPWAALRAVTGRHQDELWKEMREDWKKRFLENATDEEGDEFAPAGFGNYHRAVPAGGVCFLYRDRLDRPPALVAYDPATREEHVLLEESLTDDRSWSVSADGKKIVYASTVSSGSGVDRWRVVSDLTLAEIGRREDQRPFVAAQRKLTDRGHLWHPVLSAGGERLAAVQGAGSYSRLVLVDQATGNIDVLYAEECVQVFNPAFSPDGKLIAFTLNRRGRQDIYLIPADAPAAPAVGASGNVNLDRARPLLGCDEAGDYFPRFLDDRTVMFSSDREGSLALYRTVIDSRELFRACADRIAAFDGVPVEDGLLYATYRHTGYSLRKMPAARLTAVPVALPPDAAPLPPPASPIVESTPYIDWPGFQYWYPFFNYLNALGAYQFAFGLQALFASVMDSNAIELGAYYYPTFNQPEINLNFRTQIGPLNLYYDFSHIFREGGTAWYWERFRQSFDVELPLVDRGAASGSDYLGLSLGVQYYHYLDNAGPFPFLNGFNPSALTNSNYLNAGAQLFFSHSKYAGPAAMYPPWTVVNALDAAVYPPLFDETNPGVVLADRFYVTLPGLWDLSAWRIGLKADYQFRNSLGYSSVNPRGNFPGAPQTEPGRALLLVDYLITVAYLDAPLIGGTHLDRIGFGVHWEVPADWDIGTPSFGIDPYFYLGAEINLVVGIGRLSLPIGVGFNLRLDWAGAETPGWDDVGYYYFLSLNSFWSGAGERPPNNPRFR